MKKLLFVLLVMPCLYLPAQSWQDTVLQIDNILGRYTENTPGAQLAISRNGEIIYSAARGSADLEHNVPLTKKSLLEVGSISKQFTAACILILEQQGKLSLTDDIRKWVPEIRDYGYTITINTLLHHTSGLKDWGSIAELAGWPRTTKAYSNEDALHIIALQKTLNNKPGDEFIYSNSNYNLQAIIIERVSGLSLAEFSHKYIFVPAGMNNTSWRDNYRRIVPGRAIAYSKSGNDYLTTMPNENAYGNGGLITTAEELLQWNNFYLQGKLGTPSLLARQLATDTFNNGKRNSYAAGLFLDSINGRAVIAHSGATAGYRSNMEYFPQLRLSIAFLNNISRPDFMDNFTAIRNLFVKSLLPSSQPLLQTANPSIPKETFAPYLGAYKDKLSGAGLLLYMKADGIYSLTNGGPLPILSINELAAGRGRIDFISANPRLLRFINAAGSADVYEGVESASADKKMVEEYTGDFYSEETESATKALVKNGKLVLYAKAGFETTLSPVYKDGFSFPGGEVFFERDKNGLLTRFFISVSRARKVEFIKK